LLSYMIDEAETFTLEKNYDVSELSSFRV